MGTMNGYGYGRRGTAGVMKGRDLLSISDLNPDELEQILRTALSFKRDGTPQVLAGQTVAMLFEKPSLRTRVSFEVGMKQLGGSAIYLSQAEVGLGQREPVEDIARVLSRYVSAIIVRTYSHQGLVDLAASADVPVVNALSDDEHPCQALADLLTIREKKGRLEGVSVAFIGDGNNVSASLALACGLAGMRFTIASPHGYELPPARPFKFTTQGGRFGWLRGYDGRWHLTLRIESGRIADRPGAMHLTGLEKIAAIHQGDFRLTPNQNLVIANVPAGECMKIDQLVADHGLAKSLLTSPVRRDAIACVALPTCGLAMAEAERYLPGFAEKVEGVLARHGLKNIPLTLRITGCPNGCGRPYLAEIGMIGRAPGRYTLRLGGDATGQRMNVIYRDNIDENAILAALDELIARYAAERQADERFGDFLWRAQVLTAEKRA